MPGEKTFRTLELGRFDPAVRGDDALTSLGTHWEEMMQRLEQRPDQTALELLSEFQARYPGRYSLRQLHTLQKRVKMWRQQAVQRLIGDVTSNILGEETGNKIT